MLEREDLSFWPPRADPVHLSSPHCPPSPTPTPQMNRLCHCGSSSTSARPSFLSTDVKAKKKTLSLTPRRPALHLCHGAGRRPAGRCYISKWPQSIASPCWSVSSPRIYIRVGILWAHALFFFSSVSGWNSSCIVSYETIASSSAHSRSDDQSIIKTHHISSESGSHEFFLFLWWQRVFFFHTVTVTQPDWNIRSLIHSNSPEQNPRGRKAHVAPLAGLPSWAGAVQIVVLSFRQRPAHSMFNNSNTLLLSVLQCALVKAW